MLEINTSDFAVNAERVIDGHTYKVRRLGAGESLSLQQIVRESKDLLDQAGQKGLSQEQTDDLMTKFDALQARALKIHASVFDDGGDGSKSRELIGRLTHEQRGKLYDRIWAVAEPAEAGDGSGSTDKPKA